MSELLAKAIKKLKTLPDKEQDKIANLLFEELNWDYSFHNSQNELTTLANEALAEYRQQKTKPFRFE